jgi:D-aminoacyl-tRNA deacylase
MIGLLQRVNDASVTVNRKIIARIGAGLLVFIGIEKGDTRTQADRLLERLLGYRVFPDQDGRMNLCLADIRGGLLLVPQFTLPADTRKGMRPGFSSAAPPETGKQLFEHLLVQAKERYSHVEAGEFGADMKVTLTNDGPVTFWLQVKDSYKSQVTSEK